MLVYLYGEDPWRLAGQSNRYITVEQLSHIASQLKSILAQLRSVESSQILGSVSGGPYRNEFFPPHGNTPSRASESFSTNTARC